MNSIICFISQQFNSANFVGYKSLVIKEVHRFTRIWLQTLMAPLMTLTLYFVVFGAMVGPRIGDVHGFPYIQFIAPGLIMMAVITNSYTNISSSFFIARINRNIEEIWVSPLPNILILLGYTTGSTARGLLTGLIVTLVALFFTHLPLHHIFIIVLSVILASSLFSLAGFMNALLAKKYEDVAIMQSFILTPLIYLGGVFYSIENLPPFFRGLSIFNPMLYVINTFRYGMLGVSDINIVTSLSAMVLLIVILLLVNLSLLKRGIGKN